MTNIAWNTESNTLKGILRLAMSVVQRHPYLPSANVQYKRNIFTILSPVQELLEQLGEHAHNNFIEPTAINGCRYSTSQSLDHDYDKLDGLRSTLLSAYDALFDGGILSNLNNLLDDTSRIIEVVSNKEQDGEIRGKLIKKALRQYLIVLPFLYDINGEPLYSRLSLEIRTLIHEAQPLDLENRYCDLFTHHLYDLLLEVSKNEGKGQLKSIATNIKNQFIAKILVSAVRLYDSGGTQVTRRTISLEKIAPVLSPLRGCLAGDCSSMSVPYYGLVKNAQAFWVRKSMESNDKPSGYVFVVQVNTPDGLTPYIVTVNGVTLTAADTTAVIAEVARFYQTSAVVLPAIHAQSYLVNSGVIRLAMSQSCNSGHPIEVDMPQGWATIESYQNAHYIFGNYYSSNSLRNAFYCLINDDSNENADDNKNKISSIDYHKDAEQLRYYPAPEMSELPILARATVGYHAEQAQVGEREDIAGYLSVTPRDIDIFSRLLESENNNYLEPELFGELREAFGFCLKDLELLNSYTRTNSFVGIYQNYKDEYPIERWRDIAQKMNNEMRKDPNIDRYDNQIDAVFSIPAELIENYAGQNFPFLCVAGDKTRVNHYRVQRSLKHINTNEIARLLFVFLRGKYFYRKFDTEEARVAQFFSLLRDDAGYAKEANQIVFNNYHRDLLAYRDMGNEFYFADVALCYAQTFSDDVTEGIRHVLTGKIGYSDQQTIDFIGDIESFEHDDIFTRRIFYNLVYSVLRKNKLNHMLFTLCAQYWDLVKILVDDKLKSEIINQLETTDVSHEIQTCMDKLLNLD